jgi:hypothetical protein
MSQLQASIDRFIPVYRDFLVRQLHLLSLYSSTSRSDLGSYSLQTPIEQPTETRNSSRLNNTQTGLSRATVNFPNSGSDDVPMADALSDESSDEGFHEDMLTSWPPFGAEELFNLMNSAQITGIFVTLPFITSRIVLPFYSDMP